MDGPFFLAVKSQRVSESQRPPALAAWGLHFNLTFNPTSFKKETTDFSRVGVSIST
jgi:hypothetical protein